MKDVQSLIDTRGVIINEVGVSNVLLPISISTLKGIQSVSAGCSVYVPLDEAFRGVHMSRFLEILNTCARKSIGREFVQDVLHKVRTKMKVHKAIVELKFKYFSQKLAPVSRKKSFTSYDCMLVGLSESSEKETFLVGVTAPYTSLCPCSKEISKISAHNQRSFATVTVEVGSEYVWFEELIKYVERSASTPLINLLKRPDEKWVTEKMFENPKFVEDVVRDISLFLEKDARVKAYIVECVHEESIHQHNVRALVRKRKGEKDDSGVLWYSRSRQNYSL